MVQSGTIHGTNDTELDFQIDEVTVFLLMSIY
jgi:hypothetical protein